MGMIQYYLQADDAKVKEIQERYGDLMRNNFLSMCGFILKK